jgi:aryl-alcohol dehydrogenase-like predicted oxidoreductase
MLARALSASDRLRLARFECLQPQYSLLCRDIEPEILPLCRAEGLGVIVWAPLGRGLLSGKYRRGEPPPAEARLATWGDTYRRSNTEQTWRVVEAVRAVGERLDAPPAQVALAWVLSRPAVTCAIIGARRLDQLEENLGATDLTLPERELAALEEASALPASYPEEFLRRVGAI